MPGWVGRLAAVVMIFLGTAIAIPEPAEAATAASCSHPRPSEGRIWNDTGFIRIGIGAIHLWDCAYANGDYDQILPAGQSTYETFRWQEAAGVYIGSGYCAQTWYWNGWNGVDWSRYPGADVKGPSQVFFPGGDNKVVPYRC
jgi:hypothetical protein